MNAKRPAGTTMHSGALASSLGLGLGLALSLSLTTPARALPVRDAASDFAIEIDTDTASVCDLLASRVGDDCKSEDQSAREDAQTASERDPDVHLMSAFVARYEAAWTMQAYVGRMTEMPEVSTADEAQAFAEKMAASGVKLGKLARMPRGERPQLQDMRVDGVQVIRHTVHFDAEDARGKKRPRVLFTYYVFSRGDAHVVMLGTDEAHYAELSELAERSMATMKAPPVGKKTSVAYLVGRTAAQILLAVTLGILVVAIVRRRKRRKPIDARELWPTKDDHSA